MAKFIQLTRVYQELTEEAEAKIDAVEEKMKKEVGRLGEELTDEEGRTADWYENMGMEAPDYLKVNNNKEIIFEDIIDFTAEDYIEKRTKFLCNIDKVSYFDEVEKGTLVLYDVKTLLVVEETIEEINKKILAS